MSHRILLSWANINLSMLPPLISIPPCRFLSHNQRALQLTMPIPCLSCICSRNLWGHHLAFPPTTPCICSHNPLVHLLGFPTPTTHSILNCNSLVLAFLMSMTYSIPSNIPTLLTNHPISIILIHKHPGCSFQKIKPSWIHSHHRQITKLWWSHWQCEVVRILTQIHSIE